jgi:hypothetical protein
MRLFSTHKDSLKALEQKVFNLPLHHKRLFSFFMDTFFFLFLCDNDFLCLAKGGKKAEKEEIAKIKPSQYWLRCSISLKFGICH